MLIAWKDIRLEFRSREVVISSLVFAVLVMVLFNFALNVTPDTVDIFASGVLWVSFVFAGVLAMSRSFAVEKDKGTLDALLLCPVSRDVLFLGKMLALFVFMIVVELLLLPVFAVLFDFSAFSGTLISTIVLATLGFATLGAIFSSMAVNTRSREIMLPILFFPLVAPVIIGAVEVTNGVIGTDTGIVGSGRWLQLIAVFDAVFLVLCPWAFGIVMEE
jgi:heme exporter protein B